MLSLETNGFYIPASARSACAICVRGSVADFQTDHNAAMMSRRAGIAHGGHSRLIQQLGVRGDTVVRTTVCTVRRAIR